MSQVICSRNRAEKRRVDGVCIKCGGKLEDKKYSRCKACRAKANEQYKKKLVSRRLTNRCVYCQAELKPGSKYVSCLACRTKIRIRSGSKKAMKEFHSELEEKEAERKLKEKITDGQDKNWLPKRKRG